DAELDPKFRTFFSMQLDRERIHQDRDALQRLLREVRESTGLSADELAVLGPRLAHPDLAVALTEEPANQGNLRALQHVAPDSHILDAAVVSRQPVRDLAGRMLLLGFCGSLALAVVGAVLLDRIDPRVRYPDQVSREMGLTILGAVPHLRTLPHGRHGRGRVP